jgi:hypothetical protein
MKVQIMERKTWEKVPRATEMENSMTYVLNCYLIMGDFTVGTMFTQPLAGNVQYFAFRFCWTKCGQIILHELRFVLQLS